MSSVSVKEEKFFKNFLISETDRIRKKLIEIQKNEKIEFLQKFKIFSGSDSEIGTDSFIEKVIDKYNDLETEESRE